MLLITSSPQRWVEFFLFLGLLGISREGGTLVCQAIHPSRAAFFQDEAQVPIFPESPLLDILKVIQ
jgi:hypothetical protein